MKKVDDKVNIRLLQMRMLIAYALLSFFSIYVISTGIINISATKTPFSSLANLHPTSWTEKTFIKLVLAVRTYMLEGRTATATTKIDNIIVIRPTVLTDFHSRSSENTLLSVVSVMSMVIL